MKKYGIRSLAILLMLALMLTLGACSSSAGDYRVVETFREEMFSMAFRQGDMVGQYITAALKVLAADGTVHDLAIQWLGEDETKFEKNENALEDFGVIPVRTLILGTDQGAYPMSYRDGKEYSGFDVELARAVCELLGWTLQIQSMDETKAYAELSSGNVDVAWGGMSFDPEGNGKNLDISSGYLENSIVLVIRKGNSSNMKNQRLIHPKNGVFTAILEENPDFSEGLGEVIVRSGGNQACFNALDRGECAGILVDRVAFEVLSR